MEGREFMVRRTHLIIACGVISDMAQVRNEIAVLKRVSSGHKNIVTLHDYFEVHFLHRVG